ncbi:MAG: SUMF1/EgtB/PvdO family nonheme iron enzyme [Pyrinomonadaceae bacterium]|nr:SUMF1/EgtB/PvdO family nonheme iron enzyme [Sphingobacteriaceae bacterium]
MLRFFIAFFFNTSAFLSFAQTNVIPVDDVSKSELDKNIPLKNFLDKNFIFLDGAFIHGDFEGSDSINLKPFVKRVSVAPVYLYAREVSVKQYMAFFIENNGVYKGINLSPKADDIEGLPKDFLKNFISDKGNSNFPIMGINRAQAIAYCTWYAEWLNEKFNKNPLSLYLVKVRLPLDAEFQLAELKGFSTENLENPAIRISTEIYTDFAKYKTNTQQTLGKIPFSPVDQNRSPKLPIYNIAGNVAEWVLDRPRNLQMATDSGPRIEYYRIPRQLKNVGSNYIGGVKGGSFYHSAFYLQPGVTIPLDITKGYLWVGFRPVLTFIKSEKVN